MKTIVLFDLEATCWAEQERTEKTGNEIIEIGAVRINADTAEIIDTFDVFVKPRVNPILTQYCINLTTIIQADVDNAIEFESALNLFNDWLNKYDDIYIMSWGYYDVKQILKESNDKHFDITDMERKFIKKHINMKNQFAFVTKRKPCGMSKALRILRLKLDGTHHRGIDDSKNMARIYEKLKDTFISEIYDAKWDNYN